MISTKTPNKTFSRITRYCIQYMLYISLTRTGFIEPRIHDKSNSSKTGPCRLCTHLDAPAPFITHYYNSPGGGELVVFDLAAVDAECLDGLCADVERLRRRGVETARPMEVIRVFVMLKQRLRHRIYRV